VPSLELAAAHDSDVSVEETFGVRLSMNEMAAMKSLPTIVATLEQHLAGTPA